MSPRRWQPRHLRSVQAGQPVNLPDISDVSFPTMIGAIPSKPKRSKLPKRKKREYHGVAFSRPPLKFEEKYLSLREIPPRLDAAVQMVIDGGRDYKLRMVVEDIASFGATEVFRELVRQGASTAIFGTRPRLDMGELVERLTHDRAVELASMDADIARKLRGKHLTTARRELLTLDLRAYREPGIIKRHANRAVNEAFAFGRQMVIQQYRRKKVSYDLGGAGSGNFGHSGRPGEIGGSAPADDAEMTGYEGKGAPTGAVEAFKQSTLTSAERSVLLKSRDEYSGPLQEGEFDAWSQKRGAWERTATHAVSEGRIEPEALYPKGLSTYAHGGSKWEPLPDVDLYHVTTNYAAIMEAEGLLKSRDDLRMESGAGLGGGTSDTISFTTDPNVAKGIVAAMHEAHEAASGTLSIKEMVERAKTGDKGSRPFLSDLVRYHGNKEWRTGDPLPEGLQMLMEGEEAEYHILGMLESKIPAGARPYGQGWQARDERAYQGYIQKTPTEKLPDVRLDFYKRYAFFREAAGGPLDPLFFGSDAKALAKMDTKNVSILKYRRAPNAKGYKVSALGEWRTFSGKAVRLVEDDVKLRFYLRDITSDVQDIVETFNKAVDDHRASVVTRTEVLNRLPLGTTVTIGRTVWTKDRIGDETYWVSEKGGRSTEAMSDHLVAFIRQGVLDRDTVEKHFPDQIDKLPRRARDHALNGPRSGLNHLFVLDDEFESKHPRDDGGKFAESEGTSGGGEKKPVALLGPAPQDVELKAQAEQATTRLDTMLEGAISRADFEGTAREDRTWDDLSSAEKSEAEQHWIQEHYDEFDDAAYEGMDDWVTEQMDVDELFSRVQEPFMEQLGEKGISVDPETVDYRNYASSGRHLSTPELIITELRHPDGSKLTVSETAQAGSLFDAMVESERDTWRNEIVDSDAFRETQSETQDRLAQDAWNNLSGSDSLQAAIDAGVDVSGVESAETGEPADWKWDTDDSTDEDYLQTRAIALQLTEDRTRELMEERGLVPISPSNIADTMWSGWKESSASNSGMAMQLALSEELGVVSRLTEEEQQTARRWATNAFSTSNSEREQGAGMARLKAYVRAQWETTQYVLQKAGVDEVEVFRAIFVPDADVRNTMGEQVGDVGDRYLKLPAIKLERNSLASATTQSSVANQWNGVDLKAGHNRRVVLRFKVPREAIFSVPVYGKNMQGESEVVLAGLKSGMKWDAWADRAPEFKRVPVRLRSYVLATRRYRPLSVDLFQIDKETGKHWLNGWRKFKQPTMRTHMRLSYRERLRMMQLDWDPDLHPRDDGGKFTDSGSESGSGGSGSTATVPTRSDYGTERPTPIKVKTVADAVSRILKGEVIELQEVGTVHTVLSELAKMAEDAKAKGEAAPEYDLCKVSVAGANLFCGDKHRTKEFPNGVPRLHMPQLSGRAVPGSPASQLPVIDGHVNAASAFVEHLQARGITTKPERIPAARLKATQAELVGTKVAAMMTSKTFDPGDEPIFVSRDNYVLDGHHRWAAVVGRDAEDGMLGESAMNIIRVDAPISELLHRANSFANGFGIAAKGTKGKNLRSYLQVTWA